VGQVQIDNDTRNNSTSVSRCLCCLNLLCSLLPSLISRLPIPTYTHATSKRSCSSNMCSVFEFFFTKVHHMISLLLHNVAAGRCSAVLCWILPNLLLWDQICSHWRKLSTSTKTSWYIPLESSSFVISSLAITRFCLGEWDSIACWFCYTSDHEVHAVIFVVHFLLWSLELCLEQMW